MNQWKGDRRRRRRKKKKRQGEKPFGERNTTNRERRFAIRRRERCGRSSLQIFFVVSHVKSVFALLAWTAMHSSVSHSVSLCVCVCVCAWRVRRSNSSRPVGEKARRTHTHTHKASWKRRSEEWQAHSAARARFHEADLWINTDEQPLWERRKGQARAIPLLQK